MNNWVEGQTTGSSGQFLLDLIQVNGILTVEALIEVGPNRVLATAGLSVEQADPFSWHHFAMTANEIIKEIKRLSPKEQMGVIRFAYQLDAERKLSGPELSTLAERLINAEDPAEASRVRETIVRGFYGVERDA